MTRAFGAIADAWRTLGAKKAAALAKKAGLHVSSAELERLGAGIAKANGTRKVRLLEPSQILDAIAIALSDPHGVGVVHGGEANQGEQRTTLCLAFHERGFVTVDVGLSRAQSAGPSVTWRRELQPWSRQKPERNLDVLRAWAKKRSGQRIRVTTTAAPAETPAVEDALLAAVLRAPDDDASRAVYADRLIERGDPRGELITVQLALDAAKEGSKARAELEARSKALLREHGATWSRAVAQLTLKQEYRRGFIHAVEIRTRAFITDGARLFDLAPIERVRLRGTEGASLAKLAATPALAKIRELVFHGDVDTYGLTALTVSKHLGTLRGLDISGTGIGAAGLEKLLRACPRLEWLGVHALTEAMASVVRASSNRLVVRSRIKSTKGGSVATLAREGRLEQVPRHEI